MWKLSETAQALVQQAHDLLSSNSWFGRAKREESTMKLLEQIADQGEPAAVPIVARCLFSQSTHVKSAAARTIHRLLSVISPDQLVYISGVVGWSWGWYISEAWDKLSPKDVSSLLVDSETQAATLGLLSFHRNGYVRQEAVRLLADLKDGTELPFLLTRLNDWVEVISVDAHRAIIDRLNSDYLRHSVRCMPLVIHLLSFRRRDLSPVVHKVAEMLVQARHDALLAEVVRAANRQVRRKVVQVALDLAGDHHARVIRHGLGSADTIVRLACAKRVHESLTGGELGQTIQRLQQDRQMPVRREGFRGEAACFPDRSVQVWIRALLDPSASMRELARYYLEKVGTFDVPAFYRRELAEKTSSLAALSGLAECGTSPDMLVLRGFLAHPQPRYRHAALRGVTRIAGEGAVADLVRFLNDRSPSVARAAKNLLQPFLHIVGGDALFAVVKAGDTEFARRNALQLIVGKGKWQSLPWLIRAASKSDEVLASLARQYIEAWFSAPLCNKVFTTPSLDERKAIEAAISEGVSEELLAKLQTWLQGT